MKYLITLFLLIPSALNAMNQAPSAPEPKPVEINIFPVFDHARADKGQSTISSSCIFHGGFSPNDAFYNSNTTFFSTQTYKGTVLTLTEVIPNDAAQQLTVRFSLKPHKDKPAYDGLVIAQYGSCIPLGDGESDVRYFLHIPNHNCRLLKGPCDCPTQEHQNDLAAELAWVLAQPPTDSFAQLTIDQGDVKP